MEAMRQSWTDDRLDEFGRRIDERFDRVDQRFEQVDDDIKALRADIAREIGALRDDNRELRSALQRTMFQTGGGMIVAILGLIVTQL
jgi:hypothetical protein